MTGPGPRWAGLAPAVGVALLGAAALAVSAREVPAASAEGERILPGRESVVRRMVRDAAPPEPISSIEIDRDLVRLRRASGDPVVVVRRRGGARPLAGEVDLGGGVSLRCPGGCAADAAARAAPFAARLARSRDERARAIWDAAEPTHRARRLGWRALLVALAVATTVLARRARWFADRRLVAGVGLALAAGALTLWLAHVPLLPVHDHNTFIARADCAVDPSCERVPRGAWGAPSLALYGMFLGLLPYRLLSLSLVSLAFAALGAALLCALVAKLAERTALADRAALTGTFAGLFLACHPAFVRAAAADTPWPFAAACLLLAALSALRASEPDARPWEAWVAAGWLAVSLTSNHALLGLAPVALLAPWCFARAPLRPRPATLLGCAAWALLAAPTAREALRAVARAASDRVQGNAAHTLAVAARSVAYLDGRLTPPTWGLLVLLGLAAIALGRMRAFAVLAAGALVTQVPLGAQVPLEGGYPTFFLHGILPHYFFAAFAAVGAATALGWFPARRAEALAALAALALLPWPRSRETLAFARERRPLALEASALSSAFEALPPHDLLVVPPAVARDLDRPRRGSDPVEYAFPRGELAYVFRRRGLAPPRVVPSDVFLRQAPPAPSERVLFYLGSSFRTFLSCEIADGLVPASLERPELADVRARFALAPVLTFELPTAQSRHAEARVAADRAAHVTLGFHRLTPAAPRGPAAAP